MELVLADRKWHFYADAARENSSWYSAISNRIRMCSTWIACHCFSRFLPSVTLGYVHRCQMAHEKPNAALLSYLDRFNPNAIGARFLVCTLLIGLCAMTGGIGETLRIHGTPLSLDTVSVIARMLSDPSQPSTPIQSLAYDSRSILESNLYCRIENCSFKDMELGILAEALNSNTTLTELTISGNPVTSTSIKQLAKVWLVFVLFSL